MSAKKPTTPQDEATSISPTEHWRELEGRTGGPSDADDEVEAPQAETADAGEAGRKRALPRRARIGVAAVLAVSAVALAWIAVPALVGRGSTPQSRSTPGDLPAKVGKASGGRSSRTRWAREPDETARLRRRRTATSAPYARHRAAQHKLQRPDGPPSEDLSQPPASGAAPPEPAPEPSAPAPPAPGEPDRAGLRDGATESAEFGL